MKNKVYVNHPVYDDTEEEYKSDTDDNDTNSDMWNSETDDE